VTIGDIAEPVAPRVDTDCVLSDEPKLLVLALEGDEA
jgi:hypothetical protein